VDRVELIERDRLLVLELQLVRLERTSQLFVVESSHREDLCGFVNSQARVEEAAFALDGGEQRATSGCDFFPPVHRERDRPGHRLRLTHVDHSMVHDYSWQAPHDITKDMKGLVTVRVRTPQTCDHEVFNESGS